MKTTQRTKFKGCRRPRKEINDTKCIYCKYGTTSAQQPEFFPPETEKEWEK